ncbi:DUF6265 family protein [Niabella sp. 22666]|uniref:DUF6265 family protein n=1 Tax=Niabella sp. 22666 TaxID=3453954 RepID=UPI003F876F64
MNLKLPLMISVVACVLSCNNAPKEKAMPAQADPYEKLDSISWLLGAWTDSSKMGKATETWHRENDSTYSAESFIVSRKDTIFYEQAKLEQRNQEIQLVVKTKRQNDNEAVSFKLRSGNAEALVFGNPQHDFPTQITYTKIGSDSLYAEISGLAKGQERKVGFPFKKIAQ